jgi:hypothetical protein
MERQPKIETVKNSNGEGVNLFGGPYRINLFGLETWQQFNNVVERNRKSIYGDDQMPREAVIWACVTLQQGFEKKTDGPSGCNFYFAATVSRLEVKLESWSKGLFGWRKGRIDYISKVAKTGEWREENGVK